MHDRRDAPADLRRARETVPFRRLQANGVAANAARRPADSGSALADAGEPSCSIDALMLPLAVFIGAGIGGLARYGISVWLQTAAGATFPWGTLLVNVTGSLLLAFVYVLLEGTSAAPEWRAFLGVGVLGGYTTFSTFSFETMRLLQDGLRSQALFYVAGSVVLSLAGALLGFRLASLILRQG